MRLPIAVLVALLLTIAVICSDEAHALHRHHANCCLPQAPVWTSFGCWGPQTHHQRKQAWRAYFGCKHGLGHKLKHHHHGGGWAAGCYVPVACTYSAGCTLDGCVTTNISSGFHAPAVPLYEGETILPGTINRSYSPAPAPAPPVIDGEYVPAADPVSTTRQTSYQPVSATQQTTTASGASDFDRGVALLRRGNLHEALQAFEVAAQAEPHNALYQYHQALALFEISGAEAAHDALQLAVRLERDAPIHGWGRQMERVQGRARAWIETARRQAGLSR